VLLLSEDIPVVNLVILENPVKKYIPKRRVVAVYPLEKEFINKVA
jgi:hypothetical protein